MGNAALCLKLPAGFFVKLGAMKLPFSDGGRMQTGSTIALGKLAFVADRESVAHLADVSRLAGRILEQPRRGVLRLNDALSTTLERLPHSRVVVDDLPIKLVTVLAVGEVEAFMDAREVHVEHQLPQVPRLGCLHAAGYQRFETGFVVRLELQYGPADAGDIYGDTVHVPPHVPRAIA